MRIAMLSNFFNKHQQPVSDSFAKTPNVVYRFIETERIPQERCILGCDDNCVYVDRIYESSYQMKVCMDFIYKADVTIIGSASQSLIKDRQKNGRLIFRYSERPLKNGFEPIKYFPRLIKWRKMNPIDKPIYMLCASAFTAGDYAKFGLFKGKCYKWGYFPEARRYDHIEHIVEQKNKKMLLWCGRFLDWKHPDDAIEIAERLRDAGYNFVLKLIGSGEMEPLLRKRIKESNLENNVELLGTMSPGSVRDVMEKAGIFLFTSDRKEGWGAVLNEAMNSGCAVVASHLAGATPYLVEDDRNGYVYESGNVDELYRKVRYLLNCPEKQDELGMSAYSTIAELWNADVAAERFLKLSNAILEGDKTPDLFSTGPCSRAEIIQEDWYKK